MKLNMVAAKNLKPGDYIVGSRETVVLVNRLHRLRKVQLILVDYKGGKRALVMGDTQINNIERSDELPR